tara:strand:+ start:92 stop:2365 length:2274 start_codon:yes stop_codon:yes gene_type:complete
MANFANPTVGSAYTSFPTEIRDAVTAALQQLHVGNHTNIPTNSIKWDATDNRWKKYNGSAFVDLTSTYAFNAQISATQLSLGDNQKIFLGTSQDFELVHDGANSVIRETGTGQLFIQSDSQLNFGNVAGNSFYMQANSNNIILHSGGNEKVRTDGTGVLMPTDSKLRLGNSGQLSLVFNGVNGVIQESGSGALIIQGNFVDISTADGLALKARFIDNGAVQLFYAGAAKLATASSGVSVTGTLFSTALNTGNISAGTIGLTGELDFTGATNKFVDFETINSSNFVEFRHFGGSTFEKFIRSDANGTVELFFNGHKRIETTSLGAYVSGNIGLPDNGNFISGANSDLQIRHDGTNSIMLNSTGGLFFRSPTVMYFQNYDGSETFVQMIENSSIILYFDGLEKFKTMTFGSEFQGTLYGQDNRIISLGTGNDLRFYHNSVNSYIDNSLSSGELVFKSNVYSFRNAADTEFIAYFQAGNRVDLYFANSLKFRTESYGATVFGTFIANTVQVQAGELDFLGFGPKFVDFGTHSSGNNSYVQLRHTDHSSFFEFFLMSEANGHTFIAFDNATKITTTSYGSFYHGQIILGDSVTDEKIILQGTTNPFIRFREGTTDRAYIQYRGTDNILLIVHQESGEHLRIQTGEQGLIYQADGRDINLGLGVARATINFTGTGTVGIVNSHNVSALTDNGTGDYTVSLSITMNSSNFTVLASGAQSSTNNDNPIGANAINQTQFRCYSANAGGQMEDAQHMAGAVFGYQT